FSLDLITFAATVVMTASAAGTRKHAIVMYLLKLKQSFADFFTPKKRRRTVSLQRNRIPSVYTYSLSVCWYHFKIRCFCIIVQLPA
ncbi:MAG: hypothetical protein ACI4XQ_06860, partial [Eubacteriales bacterium]